MKSLPAAEIRERFLRFFEARGHRRMPSDSLVPAHDPTLLFTGAGMNQFKDMFLGRGRLPDRRITTAQKCLRVPDLDNVGATPRHHTFFEMLGNFSFGDYFKQECIAWEWELFTRELGIPDRKLVVTVYVDDDEAYEIWRRDIGLEPERIYRFGEKENFWPAEAPSKGPNGPCGPCSEIYFDTAPDRPWPAQQGLAALPDDRFIEIGNCVFTQYERRSDGVLAPLPQRNIDVGLGLERITAVLAGAPSNFETDLFLPLLAAAGERAGVRYGAARDIDVRLRRIADHVRALVFGITDGALPSNEGRGYVIRKILRRAARDGLQLGIEEPFLYEMVDVVGAVMGAAYPDVLAHAGQCRALIKSEEEGFAQVYHRGAQRLADLLVRHDASPPQRQGEAPVLPGSGQLAFELHDTHGFPVDITRQSVAEHGYRLDEAAFEAAMGAQRARARAATATSSGVFAESAAMAAREAGAAPTSFAGYETLEAESKIAALVGDGERSIGAAARGADVLLVAETTPFYARGGGQVGDRGTVTTATGHGAITTTTNLDGYFLHAVRVDGGELRTGQQCRLAVDAQARRATERNHTATHLLHAALKRVLGSHVGQAGSEVAPERLRFDFTHGERLTAQQIEAIEGHVNDVVSQSVPVATEVRTLAEARAAGFVAMFGEKYGERVRTLSVGEFSREICGGTHVASSAQIGGFRITSETAISAGTRRIEAVTGGVAAVMASRDRATLSAIAAQLRAPVGEAGERVQQLVTEVKSLRKQLERTRAVDIGKVFGELEAAIARSSDGNLAVLEREGLGMKDIRQILGRAVTELAPFAGVVLAPQGDHVLVGAAVSRALASRVHAGKLVRAATAAMGGGGGGKPELAQGKGADPSALPAAKAAVRGAFEAAGLAVPEPR